MVKKIPICLVALILSAFLTPQPAQSSSVDQQNGQKQPRDDASTNLPNGIVRADQFPGGDFCVKLRAANTFALENGFSLVDAVHFSNEQKCSVDPFNSLKPDFSVIKLTVLLPAAWIKSSIPWIINNSGLNIIGQGPGETWIDYMGPSGAAAVISTSGTYGHYIWNNQISELSILGGNGNVADGLYFTYAHHWKTEDINAWGVTQNGLHTVFTVTPTIIRFRTSGVDAQVYGWTNGRSTPVTAFYADSISGVGQTTDGTVIDIGAEGVSGCGIVLASAASMTFTSGTSEQNGCGVKIPAKKSLISSYNTFIGIDLECNGVSQDCVSGTNSAAGNDINDEGLYDSFKNIIASSSCNSCTSVIQTNYWGDVDGGNLTTGASGKGLNWRRFGASYVTPLDFAQVSLRAGHPYTRHTVIAGILSPAPVPPNTCAAQSFTVPGFASGDIVLNATSAKPAFQNGLALNGAIVTGNDTVLLNFCNVTSADLTPTPRETYAFDVEQ